MADGHNTDDFAQETACTSDNPVLLANETSSNNQDVSMPIPGFPPLFQFAKLQREASSWTSNATSTTSCGQNYAVADTTQAEVKTESIIHLQTSSEESNAVESSSLNGMESPSVEIVAKLQEEELKEDNEEMDKDEDKDDEDGVINDEPDEEEAESDPYFYTKRDEFTSEIYKIELQNLPKKCGYKVSFSLTLFAVEFELVTSSEILLKLLERDLEIIKMAKGESFIF